MPGDLLTPWSVEAKAAAEEGVKRKAEPADIGTVNHFFDRFWSLTARFWALAEVVFIAACLGTVLLDMWERGFSSSNGRFVSFLDSLNSCYSFRAQHALPPVRKYDRRASYELKKTRIYHIGAWK